MASFSLVDGDPVDRQYDEMFSDAGTARPDYRRLYAVVAGLDGREWRAPTTSPSGAFATRRHVHCL